MRGRAGTLGPRPEQVFHLAVPGGRSAQCFMACPQPPGRVPCISSA